MVIKFFCPTNIEIAYLNEHDEPVAYKAEVKETLAVDLIKTEDGFTTFQLVGDQCDVWDGGIFSVPFAMWDEVK